MSRLIFAAQMLSLDALEVLVARQGAEVIQST